MAETRVRYTGPIDGVDLVLDDGRTVRVSHRGEVELADYMTERDAGRMARQLAASGDWMTIQRDTTKDAAGDAGAEKEG